MIHFPAMSVYGLTQTCSTKTPLTLLETNSLPLKMDGRKMKSPFGMAYLERRAVSFRECNSSKVGGDPVEMDKNIKNGLRKHLPRTSNKPNV